MKAERPFSHTIIRTSGIGELLLVADSTRLVGIHFVDDERAPEPPRGSAEDAGHPVLRQAAQEIEEYLAGGRTEFSVPHGGEGTSFQREVWKQISRVPFGQTISYSELARRAGAPSAMRAAGTATGSNPLAIMVPCHRIVGKNGGLGGFGGGLERKKRLLRLEGDKVLTSAG